MADFNAPDFLREYKERITSEETINKLTQEREGILKRLQTFYENNLKFNKVNSEELTQIYEQEKRRIEEEYKLKELRSKSIADVQKELKIKQENLKIDRTAVEAQLKLATQEGHRVAMRSKLKIIDEELTNLQERQSKLEDDKELKANKLLLVLNGQKKLLSDSLEKQEKALKSAKDTYDYTKILRDKGLATDEDVAAAKSSYQSSLNKSEALSGLLNIGTAILNNLKGMVSNALSSIDSRLKDGVNLYSDNMGKVNARLQSLDAKNAKTFNDIINNTRGTIGASSFVSYKDYLASVIKLSEEGISYNIEERAFLETISDKMVASFDSLDASLLRMTRLQQADMTRLMLGNEITLTRLFNEFFEDSSYLATNVSDSISSAVFDAASTMNSAAASAFEFTVQKWLGALYEVGVSQETVSSLASAINALGSGNAQAFMSSPVAVLLNMAIARGDYSLSDVLTQGLNTEFIDDMMKSMITLLTDIKDNTSNQVTLQAYSNVMGMSMADLRGVTNLTEADIAALSGYGQTAQESTAAVQGQIKALNTRTTLKERLDNAIDNLFIDRGMALGSDSGAYMGYLIGDFVEQATRGTLLSVAGTAVKILSALGATYEDTDWDSFTTSDLLNNMFSSALVDNLADMQDKIGKMLKPAGNDGLTGALSGRPYEIHSRGASFLGVSPDYGSNYGKVSSGTSVSGNVTYSNPYYASTTSSEQSYSFSTNMNQTSNTEQRIAHLDNTENSSVSSNFFSHESAEAMKKEITLSDFYNEIFLEHNYPIWIDFAPDTLSFLDKWYSTISKNEENIHARQHDTHVTNTVNVTGSVDISGGYGVNSIISAVRSGGF